MQFNQRKLDNGLSIVTIPMVDNPAVTVLVMVSAGSKYETKNINGISHFLEHMVFKGTKKRPKAIDISKELDSLGAQYNALTSQEYTGYYAKSDPEHLDTILDIVSDIYLNPLLDTKEIEKEKGVIIEEIKMYQDMPNYHIADVFMNLIYGDQPAGWNIAGTEDNVKSFNEESLLEYVKQHYVAEATTVIVSGSFNEENVLNKIKEKFSNISINKKLDKVKVKEEQNTPNILIKYKETDQAHLILGFRSFDAKSKYDPSLNVLATLLGKGMSSRLFQKLRDEMGVCYYIRANQDSYTDHGIFSISAGVDTKRIKEVISVLLSECMKIINDPIDKDEIKKVKSYICGSFMLSLETSDARAEYAALDTILKGNIISPEEEIEKIQSINEDMIKDIAKRIFIDENLNLAIIGPYKDKEEFKNILTFKN